MTRYLCLDPGEKRIGMATGDPDVRLAHALGVIHHRSRKADIAQILKVIHENQIDHIVIGISLQEDGSPNAIGRHALSFGKDLELASGLAVEYWDEAFSTVDARFDALQMGFSRRDRRGHQDALAATEILLSFFNRLKSI